MPAFLLFAQIASAQADPDAVKRRNNCRLATQVLETGNPAPRLEWAWQYIGICEPEQRAASYLSAMQKARVSTDLDVIHRALLSGVHFRDGRLFEELLDIAESRSASVPARVVALVALASISDSLASPHYEDFVGGLGAHGLPRGMCSRRQAHAGAFELGPTPMPSNYLQRVVALRDRVRSDDTQSADVRSAAACR